MIFHNNKKGKMNPCYNNRMQYKKKTQWVNTGGCKFSIGGLICKRVISPANVKMLLETGQTAEIRGFASKKGKPFDAVLKLEGGKVVFDFS